MKIEKRDSLPRYVEISAPILSLGLALFSIAVMFWIYGANPLLTYQRIFRGAFGSWYGLSETITKSIPLLLCGLGLAVAFKMGFWNIGAEGQLLMGAVGATWVVLYFIPHAPFSVMLTLVFCVGFAAGAGWGLIPAVLKAKFRANEVIVSLMLVYIASELVNYLVYGPWKSPYEWGFPYSTKFPVSAQIPTIPNTRIHYPTLVLALVLAILIYILMRKTKLGYEIEVLGARPEAARYAGIESTRIILLVMVISGGMAGLAGVGEVAGIHRRLMYPSGISPGYGFTAIIVAWLGKLNPLFLILAAFLFGGLLVGGDAIQVTLGFPVGVINIFNGVILFFLLAGEFFTHYKLTK